MPSTAHRASIHADTLWIKIAPAFIVGNRQEFVALTAELPSAGVRIVVADFFETAYVDSSALGALYALSQRLRVAGGHLAVQNLRGDLRQVLELTKLDTEIVVVEDRRHEQKCQLIIPRFDQINQELIEYFARNPQKLDDDLDWRGFELLVEAIFRNQGFRTEIGSGRADGGVDIRLLQSDQCGDLVSLVQVKKYEKDRPIRLEAVQALCAVVEDQKANRGIFVTTSRYLPSARQFADRQGARLSLRDGADVARWCRELAERGIR
jgi:anti-anti-sigma regulatory factor